MSNPYSTFCEDFYINTRLGSQLVFPHQRDTVLHLCETLRKRFPDMNRFRRSDGGEVSLEEDRDQDSYRWLTLEGRRLSAGHVNPTDVEQALDLHKLILELAPHHLGLSPLEIEYFDVLFGFDLEYSGNHDDVIADSLFGESPLSSLIEEPDAKAIDFQPSVTIALSDDCRLQARLDVVTRTNSYQIRTGEYSDEAISVYLILRRYWGDHPRQSPAEMLSQLAERADALCSQYVAPRVLKPIASAIASRS